MKLNFHLFLGCIICLILFNQVAAQDVISETEKYVWIYQNGSMTSIDPETGVTQDTRQLSMTFMPETDLPAIWTEYDAVYNRVYMIVENEPFNGRTGKQLRSLVSVDLTNQKEEVLYTAYNLQELRISPDGKSLVVHRYKIGDLSNRPTGSELCVFSIATDNCQLIDLDYIIARYGFHWLDNETFVLATGRLTLCQVKQNNCETILEFQDSYVKQAIPTNQPTRILVAASLYQPLYDGTTHLFYFDIITRARTELEQLKKVPVYTADNLAIIQDDITYINLSYDNRYIIVNYWSSTFSIIELTTGTPVLQFEGSYPQWIGRTNTYVDATFSDNRVEVYTLNVEKGVKTSVYSSDQPFNLIVP